MAGSVYVAAFENVTCAAVQDLFEITAGSANPLRVRRVRLSSAKIASEVLRVAIARNTSGSTSGSGGTTPTKAPVNTRLGAATATVEANNTTQITGGTRELLISEQWNCITPYEWIPAEDDGKANLAASARLIVSLDTAPSSAKFSGWIEWEEFGV